MWQSSEYTSGWILTEIRKLKQPLCVFSFFNYVGTKSSNSWSFYSMQGWTATTRHGVTSMQEICLKRKFGLWNELFTAVLVVLEYLVKANKGMGENFTHFTTTVMPNRSYHHHHHSFDVLVPPFRVGRTAPMFVLIFFLYSILFAGSFLVSFPFLRSSFIVSLHVFLDLPRPRRPSTSSAVILLIQPSFIATWPNQRNRLYHNNVFMLLIQIFPGDRLN